MKTNIVKCLYAAAFPAALSVCVADEYEIRGMVLTESAQPTSAMVTVVPTNNPTSYVLPVQTSNGAYTIVVNVTSGTVVQVSAQQGLSGGLGIYSWSKTIALASESVVTNVNLTVPTVNTSVVSITGQITIDSSPPTDNATVVLRKTQQQYGQEFQAAKALRISGFPGTNVFSFVGLQTGDYEISAKADSTSWTQLVISVTSTNIPVQVNIDF